MTEEKVNHEQMHYKYKRLYESLGKTVGNLEATIKALSEKNSLLEKQIKQWEKSLATQQGIIQQTIANSNAMSQAYLEENSSLKEQIKSLREKLSP